MRIKKLPALIANQIAAGEVIERPASVVKELLENAQDAGAKNISIELGFAGLNQIKISDDGHGIFKDDLPLAIVAHATSKIASLEDLYSISSMGFRGEALASISSVAKLIITSRPEAQKHGAQLEASLDGATISPSPRAVGTTIEVLDLFYNAPVRKKFLRGQRTELQYVEDIIKRFALAAPYISLNVKHNDKEILNIPAGFCENSRRLRIKKIFGAKFVDSAIKISAESSGMRLQGWLGSPDYQRSQRDKQWVYLNNRMVRDKLLQHAVMQAYQEHLIPGRYPACLLYLDMPSASVDVNVHPTKHEVRFKQPRDVHDFLLAALTRSIAKPVEIPNLQEEQATVKDYKKLYQVDSAPTAVSEVANLHVLNAEFAIYYQAPTPYLVNLAAAYKELCAANLKEASYPLPQRPMLVPFSYKFNEDAYNNLLSLQDLLLEYGLTLDFVSANKLVLRTIPLCLPLLDIKSFLDEISSNRGLDRLKLANLIIESQDFNAQLIGVDEQRELMEFIISKSLFAKCGVHLTNARCQDLFVNV